MGDQYSVPACTQAQLNAPGGDTLPWAGTGDTFYRLPDGTTCDWTLGIEANANAGTPLTLPSSSSSSMMYIGIAIAGLLVVGMLANR